MAPDYTEEDGRSEGTTSTISVYMYSGTVYEYTCHKDEARDHVYKIAESGYRRVDSDNVMTLHMPASISKIKASNQKTYYVDRVRGT